MTGVERPSLPGWRWLLSGLLVVLIGVSWLARPMLLPTSGRRLAAMPLGRTLRTQPGHASILFGGDTHFGESYFAPSDAPSVLGGHSYEPAVALLRPLAATADAVIVNLETPLTVRTDSPLRRIKRWVHWGDPVRTADVLRGLGVRAVSLANNHAFDGLAAGLADTETALTRRGIDFFGAGATLAQAARPYRLDLAFGRQTVRLCVLGTLRRTWRDWARGAYATSTGPGTFSLAKSTLTAQIRAIKAADPTLFVVAFPHWGDNYAWRSPEQSRLGRALLDAGADLVLGHGAHVFQEIEPYRHRLILHGLGNFVFLSPGRYQNIHPWSLAARLDFTEQDRTVRLAVVMYFLASDNRATGYQPQVLGGEAFQRARRLLLEGGTLDARLRQELGQMVTTGQDAGGEFLRIDIGPVGEPPARER